MHLDWNAWRETAQEIADAAQVTQQVKLLLEILGDNELGLKELMTKLSLSDRNNFTKNYLNPALEAGVIERTTPDKLTSRLQKYRRASR